MTLERHLRRRIVLALEQAGCVVFPQPATPMGLAGRPDIVACAPGGRFLAVEVKGPAGRVTPRQALLLEQVRAAGGVAGVARSVEDALKLVEEARCGDGKGADCPDQAQAGA